MKKQVLVAALSLCVFASCTRIKPSYAGFKINYSGDYRGTDSLPQEVGWVWYTPGFSTVIEFPTSMQHVIYSESSQEGSEANQEIIVGLKGGSSFKMDVGLNYTVKSNRVAHLYFKFKTNDLTTLNDGYIRNTTRKVLNDLAGGWTMDSLLNARPKYEKAATDTLSKLLGVDGLVLNQLTILKVPVATDPNLEDAIISKITARQIAEKKQIELQSFTADANKVIATAKGDSARMVMNANASAYSNKIMEQSLTSGILQKMWIEKWKGEVPVYQLGSNTSMMMQIPTRK